MLVKEPWATLDFFSSYQFEQQLLHDFHGCLLSRGHLKKEAGSTNCSSNMHSSHYSHQWAPSSNSSGGPWMKTESKGIVWHRQHYSLSLLPTTCPSSSGLVSLFSALFRIFSSLWKIGLPAPFGPVREQETNVQRKHQVSNKSLFTALHFTWLMRRI